MLRIKRAVATQIRNMKISTYAFIDIFMHLLTYLFIYYLCIHLYTCEFTYAFIYAFINIFMYVCICMHAQFTEIIVMAILEQKYTL